MHRVSQQHHHARTARPWLWATAIAAAVIAAAVWAARPYPEACRAPVTRAAPIASPSMVTVIAPNAPAPDRFSITQRVDPPVIAQARYYTFSPDLACSFPNLPANGYYVGGPTGEYDRSAGFWSISGGGAGPFTALVTDADGHQVLVAPAVVPCS